MYSSATSIKCNKTNVKQYKHCTNTHRKLDFHDNLYQQHYVIFNVKSLNIHLYKHQFYRNTNKYPSNLHHKLNEQVLNHLNLQFVSFMSSAKHQPPSTHTPADSKYSIQCLCWCQISRRNIKYNGLGFQRQVNLV